jgi:hypothetical protein
VNMLTPFGGLCRVGFTKGLDVVAGVRRQKVALYIGPIGLGSA